MLPCAAPSHVGAMPASIVRGVHFFPADATNACMSVPCAAPPPPLPLSQKLVENSGSGVAFYGVSFGLSVGLWHASIWLRGHPDFLAPAFGL